MHDISQTIIAPASANGPGARAIVRVSGSQTVAILRQIAELTDTDEQRPTVVSAKILLTPTAERQARMPGLRMPDVHLPVEIWLWPTARSYTRQPLAEIHLPESPPLVELLLARLTEAGARLAQPGEFTLRAYLAGRLDLLQAEAVLGLIDARDDSSFHAALAQLAGGFSAPLDQLRSDLLDLLADLEAGLDFVDEDLEFVGNDEVQRRLRAAESQIATLLQRLASRDAANQRPRAVLLGSPNAGKSQLFNALVGMALDGAAAAIVSPIAGTTRDYLRGRCDCDGMLVELIDTAGIEDPGVTGGERSENPKRAGVAGDDQRENPDELIQNLGQNSQGSASSVPGPPLRSVPGHPTSNEVTASSNSPAALAQQQTHGQRAQADLQLWCYDLTAKEDHPHSLTAATSTIPHLDVGTKADLLHAPPSSPRGICTSALTGAGLDELRREIARCLRERPGEIMASSAARCRGSLAAALAALRDAGDRAKQAGQDEWLAADLRAALAELGQVTGAVQTNDLLDRIFSRFCIGK